MHHSEYGRWIHKRGVLTYKVGVKRGYRAARKRNEPNKMKYVIILLSEQQSKRKHVARRTAKAIGNKLLPIWITVFKY
jgi:hypothetical protein